MKRTRRWIAGLLAAAVMAAASISCGFAISTETPFGEFRIDAYGMDKPERNISVNIYHRDDSGQFQVYSGGEYPCKLNRVTIDAGFFIQANTEGVWMSVDYLTDVNGDGVYELLEDDSDPVWDIMETGGTLIRPEKDGEVPTLTVGQPYMIPPEVLVYRGKQAAEERASDGPYSLYPDKNISSQQIFPLCMVKLHHTDPDDGLDYTQTYYLQIYNEVLIPFDVSPSAWYYDAVSFGLSQGYFAGGNDGYFFPEACLPRAQMAQVLWAMSGSPDTDGSQTTFTDVSPDDWFYSAVSWCQQEKLISGYTAETFAPTDPLSREQMTVILHNHARYMNSPLQSSDDDLSRFSDADSVSDWAIDSMRWAVTNGLISGSDGALRPQDIVTRAELASALYSYLLNEGLHGQGIYD